jgi:uncharacterized protein YceH (UPF0502 family)
LFSGEEALPLTPAEAGTEAHANAVAADSRASLQERVSMLEQQVAALREELEELRGSIKSS